MFHICILNITFVMFVLIFIIFIFILIMLIFLALLSLCSLFVFFTFIFFIVHFTICIRHLSPTNLHQQIALRTAAVNFKNIRVCIQEHQRQFQARNMQRFMCVISYLHFGNVQCPEFYLQAFPSQVPRMSARKVPIVFFV